METSSFPTLRVASVVPVSGRKRQEDSLAERYVNCRHVTAAAVAPSICVSPSPRCCVARLGSSKINLAAHSPLRPRQQRFLPPPTPIERLLITYTNTDLTKYTATHDEMDSIEPEQTPFAAVSAQSTKFQRVCYTTRKRLLSSS